MKEIKCYCNNPIKIDFPDQINLETDPGYEKEILDGNFMTFKCTECGKDFKPELPVRLVDKSRDIDIQFLPELDRRAFYNKKIQFKNIKRIAIGFPELLEKFIIINEGLKDEIIELIKFYLISKIPDKESCSEINIFFDYLKDNTLFFNILGLKKDEVGISRIPFSFYLQTSEEIDSKRDTEPFKSFLTPPYVSINNI